jgi:hypothetical protein
MLFVCEATTAYESLTAETEQLMLWIFRTCYLSAVSDSYINTGLVLWPNFEGTRKL